MRAALSRRELGMKKKRSSARTVDQARVIGALARIKDVAGLETPLAQGAGQDQRV